MVVKRIDSNMGAFYDKFNIVRTPCNKNHEIYIAVSFFIHVEDTYKRVNKIWQHFMQTSNYETLLVNPSANDLNFFCGLKLTPKFFWNLEVGQFGF